MIKLRDEAMEAYNETGNQVLTALLDSLLDDSCAWVCVQYTE